MIYVDLLLGFLRVGCFAFGGAYGAIPLIRDVVLTYGWLTDEALSYMIAVSESTPGPIMVNLATYVGSSQAGILGAVVATLAVVLPSFVVLLMVTVALGKFRKNPYIQAALRGMKPCIIGIVLATGLYMTVNACVPSVQGTGDVARPLIIAATLVAAMTFTKPLFHKKLSPIALIVIAAVLGVVVYGV